MAKQQTNQSQQKNTVQTYTNTGDGGGTGYYINIGGIKYCWGTTGVISFSGAGTKIISLPPGFFNTIQSATHDKFGNTVVPTQAASPPSTSAYAIYFGSGASGNQVQLTWFVVGT